MLIPRGALLERSCRALVERGKVWAGPLQGVRLRDVPNPRETGPSRAKGLQRWIRPGDAETREGTLERAAEMPPAQSGSSE